MTHQPDDRGDDAAEDRAADGIRERWLAPPSRGSADPGRILDADAAAIPGVSLHPKNATPMEMRTNLARLESAFPAFSFVICRGPRGPRFEAWRDNPMNGLYAIFSDDPDELWRELMMAPR